MGSAMKIGLNVFGDKVTGSNEEMKLVTDNGEPVDLAVCHVEDRNYTPEKAVTAPLCPSGSTVFRTRFY